VRGVGCGVWGVRSAGCGMWGVVKLNPILNPELKQGVEGSSGGQSADPHTKDKGGTRT
jgi:hypothetical protein